MSKPYRTCPKCGAHLDAGERCDCEDRAEHEPSQSAANLAYKPATKDGCQPMLMSGARYETCQEWNVSCQAVIPWNGYLCSRCRRKRRKEAQGREGSKNQKAGSCGRGLRRDPFVPE